MSEHSTFDICVEPIELYKLLKIANMVGGGEANTWPSLIIVLVNNEIEIQKRKKIRRGDIIECNGKSIEIAFNPAQKSAEFISTVVSASKSSKKKKRAKSKARAISADTDNKSSTERSKRKSV